jgi:hypothetical protein
MRVIFITHPENRTALLQKIAHYENGTSKFTQLLIIENEYMHLNMVEMKYFGREQGKSFVLREKDITSFGELVFT